MGSRFNRQFAERFKGLDKLNLVKLAYGGKALGSSRFSLLPQKNYT